tara:strand:+ start:532 stop:774 length:243 start_codon:yes stop_codon:yes gene_type:complete
MNWRANKMDQIILSHLGKRKVKSIVNQWIKDQINRALQDNQDIVFDSTIHLDKYVNNLKGLNIETSILTDTVFKFIGNKI